MKGYFKEMNVEEFEIYIEEVLSNEFISSEKIEDVNIFISKIFEDYQEQYKYLIINNLITDRYKFTLNLLRCQYADKKFRLPINTLKSYLELLIDRIKINKDYISIDIELMNFTSVVLKWTNFLIKNNPEKILKKKKESEFVKISKTIVLEPIEL